MSNLAVRPIALQEQKYFTQYLLPQTAQQVQAEAYTLLGALAGTLACGAAAIHWEEDHAELSSLFLDPQIRGRGLGGALMDLAIQTARERGVHCLKCSFVLDGEELEAMNALFAHRGGTLWYCAPVCCVDASVCVEKRFVGPALRSGYKTSPYVVPFSQLTQEQLVQLEARTDIPAHLTWAGCAHKCDPELSLAWVRDGQISAYVLGGESPDGGYVLAAAWRGSEAPGISVLSLLRTQLNRCWYQAGGAFLYYFSPVSPAAQALTRRIVQNDFREYAQMYAELRL